MLLVRESAAECDPQDRGQEPDIRHRDRQDGVGMRDAAELTHDGPRIDKVLQYIGADDQVEAASSTWMAVSMGSQITRSSTAADSTALAGSISIPTISRA